MKKLRLLLWEKCNRRCSGCCNKQWDLKHLPLITPKDCAQYDEILITGGEPLFFPDILMSIVKDIRFFAPLSSIYIYTARLKLDLYFDDHIYLKDLLEIVDGFTITLHTAKDVNPLIRFDKFLDYCEECYNLRISGTKSLRLNIFEEVSDIINTDILSRRWQIKNNMKWIDNCPLPDGEVFYRLAY